MFTGTVQEARSRLQEALERGNPFTGSIEANGTFHLTSSHKVSNRFSLIEKPYYRIRGRINTVKGNTVITWSVYGNPTFSTTALALILALVPTMVLMFASLREKEDNSSFNVMVLLLVAFAGMAGLMYLTSVKYQKEGEGHFKDWLLNVLFLSGK